MTPPIRIAIAGYGFIADVHARAARAMEGVEVVAAFGRSRDKLEDFGRRHGVDRQYTSAEELAADPGVDAVVVALPNRLHAPLTLRMLEAGKHVLVEKPMATSAEQAEQMLAMAKARDLRLLVGHMWRFDREALYLKRAIEQRAVGEIWKTKGYGIHANWGPSGWFVDRELSGGGALVDLGVHAIDTARFLLGDPAPVSVFARLGTAYGDYQVDDWGVVLINWSSGAVSLVESGWWNPHMDGPEASTQLFGTHGYARLFPTEITRVASFKPCTERPSFPPREEHCDRHLFEAQMAEFAAAIREGRDPVPGAEHGLVVMRICDAAYRSSREGQLVQMT
jgi:predicted dehydrogenase